MVRAQRTGRKILARRSAAGGQDALGAIPGGSDVESVERAA
jgi:hypothetical protein